MNIYSCKECGKEFKRRGTNKLRVKFCSLSCRYKHQKKIPSFNKGIKNGKFINCEICNKNFYVTPSKVGRTRYCSMKCRNKGGYVGKATKGPNHWNWKGGKVMIGEYVYIISKGHPFGHKKTEHVAEHRLIMEKKIGRYLTPNEEVHHRNGIKTDNKIENLEIVVKKTHFGNVICPHCLKEFKIK